MSFEGACPVCTHTWTEALTGTQCCFGGYRRFLPPTSRGRERRVRSGGYTYQYSKEERRSAATKRTAALARHCLDLNSVINSAHGGHKHTPLLALWLGFDWLRLLSPDLMHGESQSPRHTTTYARWVTSTSVPHHTTTYHLC